MGDFCITEKIKYREMNQISRTSPVVSPISFEQFINGYSDYKYVLSRRE